MKTKNFDLLLKEMSIIVNGNVENYHSDFYVHDTRFLYNLVQEITNRSIYSEKDKKDYFWIVRENGTHLFDSSKDDISLLVETVVRQSDYVHIYLLTVNINRWHFDFELQRLSYRETEDILDSKTNRIFYNTNFNKIFEFDDYVLKDVRIELIERKV